LRMELAGVRLGTMPLVDDAFILHDESISLRSIVMKRYYIGIGTAMALRKFGKSDLFSKYFSSGTQEGAKLFSKYRFLINRARMDPCTILPLLLLIPLRAISMRIGFYLGLLS